MARYRILKALGTVLLKIGAFWILLVAAYLALGRQFFPQVERYNAELALLLSDRLNASVSIGSLTGEWRQFNPILIAEDVSPIALHQLLKLGADDFVESRLYAGDYDRRYRPVGTEPRFPEDTE